MVNHLETAHRGALGTPRARPTYFQRPERGGRTPQTPKPFTHVPDTYLKYPNLEYKYHPPVDPFVPQPFVRNVSWVQRRPCPYGATTLSDSHNSVTSGPRYYVPSTERHSIWPIRHAVRFPSEAVSKGTGLGLKLKQLFKEHPRQRRWEDSAAARASVKAFKQQH